MPKTLPISEFRVNLGSITKQVMERGGYVVVEKSGIPVTAYMKIDDLEDYLELNDPKIQKRIEESYRDYKAGKLIPARKVMAEMRKKYPIE